MRNISNTASEVYSQMGRKGCNTLPISDANKNTNAFHDITKNKKPHYKIIGMKGSVEKE